MWNQALIVRGIHNKALASQLTGFRAAASSVMVKEGGKYFDDIIKGLNNG